MTSCFTLHHKRSTKAQVATKAWSRSPRLMKASTLWTSQRSLFCSWKGSVIIDMWLETMSFLPVKQLRYSSWDIVRKSSLSRLEDFFDVTFSRQDPSWWWWQVTFSQKPHYYSGNLGHPAIPWRFSPIQGLFGRLESPPMKMHDQCSAGKEQPEVKEYDFHEFHGLDRTWPTHARTTFKASWTSVSALRVSTYSWAEWVAGDTCHFLQEKWKNTSIDRSLVNLVQIAPAWHYCIAPLHLLLLFFLRVVFWTFCVHSCHCFRYWSPHCRPRNRICRCQHRLSAKENCRVSEFNVSCGL